MNSYLTQLALEHGPMLERSARKLGFDDDAARDLVQSVWLVLMEGWHRFEGRSAVRTYVFGILRNKARERWRSRKTPPAQDDVSPSFEDTLLERERVVLLRDCVDELSPGAREAISLELDGVTKPEAAARLAMPINRLYVVLHRAKHALFDCMSSEMSEA
jgi:RNA polymerase sigma-70 factor (ECF subfamily)